MQCLLLSKLSEVMTSFAKFILCSFFCCSFQSSFAQILDTQKIGISTLATGKVVVGGVVNNDTAPSPSAGMVYGPGAVGFVASIFFQNLATSGSRNSHNNKLQEEADKVIAPYSKSLDKFEYTELMEQSLKLMSSNNRITKDPSSIENDWRVSVMPSFRMTQDQSALMVENVVSLYKNANKTEEKPDFSATVRVWSTPESATDTVSLWVENNGEKLKNLAASLTTQSIEIAINEWTQKEKREQPAYTSVRYLQGSIVSIERAQILDTRCDRLLIRNLRNVLVSVPQVTIASQACSSDKTARTKESTSASAIK
jgi:hypothetical protein